MNKIAMFVIITTLLLVSSLAIAYRLDTVPYIESTPESQSESESKPEPSYKQYRYVNITIYEKFRRPSYKWRRFGAVLSNGKLIQFHGDCYTSIENGDLVSIYNWNWNWFYTKRWMEVWRNGTFIGTFIVWFY